jgi:uncharacterized membrane protein
MRSASAVYKQPGHWFRFKHALHHIGHALGRHWLLIVNCGLGIWLATALLVPVLELLGLHGIAAPIFSVYHLACGQIPSHSYFIFGHQCALCQRCLAIYSAMFLTSLAITFQRRRHEVEPLRWWAWLLLMVPMALDGGTQLVGLRQSTWELRTITGLIFGLGCMWFALPTIDRAVRDLQIALVSVSPVNNDA